MVCMVMSDLVRPERVGDVERRELDVRHVGEADGDGLQRRGLARCAVAGAAGRERRHGKRAKREQGGAARARPQETARMHGDYSFSMYESWCSANRARPYKAMASSASISSVAKTRGVSKLLRAISSRPANPWLPVTNSPTTAPVIERVRLVRNPARMAGSDSGDSICQSSCQRVAPSTRAASSTSRSSGRKPSAVETTAGKKTISAQSTATGGSP